MTTQPTISGRIPTWTQGDLLRKARVSAGYTVAELAVAAGISEKTINNYEGDRYKPRRPALIAWALATGVDLAWLEGGVTDPSGPDGGAAAGASDAALAELTEQKVNRGHRRIGR
ncbi:hypothetical protein GCM10022215_08510 [Nocardioides fonticola]|uniref:HTH cro/C1-type domain-containing protein n=1 Tax=Nocardioides fonticola TaxID=450363 RepID=A0ABP7XD83_9ACTN